MILIVDPNGIAAAIGASKPRAGREEERETAASRRAAATESLLVFRAGSPNPKAVPISLVTRLEEIDAATIETTSGRPLVQYRGQLMPLVPVNADVRIRTERHAAAAGVLRRRALDGPGGRRDRRHRRGSARHRARRASEPGLIGSAVIKGQATEIIDVAHFLPLAFDDWRDWREHGRAKATRRILLVDDAPFFRNMLAPVLKAAGYDVTSVASAREALALGRGRRPFRRRRHRHRDARHGRLRARLRLCVSIRAPPACRSSVSSSLVSAEAVERGKEVGLRGYVAKFDRQMR